VNTQSHRAIAWSVLAVVLLGASSVAAQSPFNQQVESLLHHPGGLTADHAASRARSLSYEVQARRAEAAAAATRVVQAELGLVPRVAARASYTRVSDVGLQSLGNSGLGFTYPSDNFGVQVEIVVPVSDYVLRVGKQLSSAKHSARAAALMASATEAAAATNARLAYYAWARARLREQVALAALELTRQHLADAKAGLAAGRASQADVMQIEAKYAEKEVLVARAKSAIVIEQERLRLMLHDPLRASYEIGEPLLEPLAPLPQQHDLSALFEEAQRRRPELRALLAVADSLRDDASQHTIGIVPRFDAIGSAQYANPNLRYFPPDDAWNGTWALGATVSWTSVDAIVSGTSASVARDMATSTSARAGAVRDGIRDELLQALRAVQDAELAIEATQRSSLAAEEAYRVRRALFGAAQSTSTELSDTETVLTQARVAAIDARIDLRIARARLVHAVGRDTPAGQ